MSTIEKIVVGALCWILILQGLLAIAMIETPCNRLREEIKADRELIQSLYYTISQQEIACEMAIEKAQVSCVD